MTTNAINYQEVISQTIQNAQIRDMISLRTKNADELSEKSLKFPEFYQEFSLSIDPNKFKLKVADDVNRRIPTIRIDGFRPGKAPKSIIDKQLTPQIMQENLNEILQAFHHIVHSIVIDQMGKNILGEPELQLPNDINFLELTPKTDQTNTANVSKSEPFTVSMSVCVTPDAPLNLDDSEIAQKFAALTRYELEPSQEELTKMTQDLLNRLNDRGYKYISSNKLSTAQDTSYKSKESDCLIIDFNGKINNEEFPGGKGLNVSLHLGSGSFLPEFEANLLGASEGEVREFTMTFPEKYEPSVAGKEVTFTVTVKDVMVLDPEVNQEENQLMQIKSTYNVESLEELQQKMAEVMHNEYKNFLLIPKYKRDLFDLLEKILEDFAIPEELIESEYKGISGNSDELAKELSEMEKLDYSNDKEAFEKKLRKIAARRMKLAILLMTLAKKHNIVVTQNDFIEMFKTPNITKEMMQKYHGLILENKLVEAIWDKIKDVAQLQKITYADMDKLRSELEGQAN